MTSEASKPGPGDREAQARLYRSVRETIERDKLVEGLLYLPEADNRRLRALLEVERRAWLLAYASPVLLARVGLDPSGTGIKRDGPQTWERDDARAQWMQHNRHLFGNTLGELHTHRLPGDDFASRFLTAREAADVKTVLLSGRDEWKGPTYGWLSELSKRAERDGRGAALEPALAKVFLGMREGQAEFIVATGDGTRRVVGVEAPVSDNIRKDLVRLAMPAQDAERLRDQTTRDLPEQERLSEQVRRHYGKALHEVPRGRAIQGRVDRLIKTPGGASAVVVSTDAVYLMRLEAAQAQQAQAMVGRVIELTRESDGLRMSRPSRERQLDRARPRQLKPSMGIER